MFQRVIGSTICDLNFEFLTYLYSTPPIGFIQGWFMEGGDKTRLSPNSVISCCEIILTNKNFFEWDN